MDAVRTDAGRRFVCRVILAAVAVWGMLWPATAEAYQPPMKTDPKAEAKEEEKLYDFPMNGKPWKDVFVWITENTGFPVVGVAIPAGKLKFVGPANKKYTLAQILDLIHAGLKANDPKCVLILRKREFLIVPVRPKPTALLPPKSSEDCPGSTSPDPCRPPGPSDGHDGIATWGWFHNPGELASIRFSAQDPGGARGRETKRRKHKEL